MAGNIPARLTPVQGRSFGLTVGLAFVALALFGWWRGHPATATVLGVPGLLLALAGLAIPTRLGPIQRAWMGLAHAISKVTTPIVMGAIYFCVLTPVGLLRRRLGGNPLVHRSAEEGYWKSRPEGARRSGSMKRQF